MKGAMRSSWGLTEKGCYGGRFWEVWLFRFWNEPENRFSLSRSPSEKTNIDWESI